MKKRSTAKPRVATVPDDPAKRHTDTVERFKNDATLLGSKPVTAELVDLALTYWVGYPSWLSAIRGGHLLYDNAYADWRHVEEQHLAHVHQCALEALVTAAQAAGLQSDAIYESGQWCRRLCAGGAVKGLSQWPTEIPSKWAPAEILAIVDKGYHQLLRLTNRATLPAVPEPPGGGPWSEPDSPSRWAKVFKISPATFVRHVRGGRIHAKKLSDKSYQVALSNIPRPQTSAPSHRK